MKNRVLKVEMNSGVQIIFREDVSVKCDETGLGVDNQEGERVAFFQYRAYQYYVWVKVDDVEPTT